MEAPPLPEPAMTEPRFHAGADVYMPNDVEAYFTADQMRAYAMEAVKAETARLGLLRERPDLKALHLSGVPVPVASGPWFPAQYGPQTAGQPSGVKVDQRSCTCHPDDSPPKPCPRKFALNECRVAAASIREGG